MTKHYALIVLAALTLAAPALAQKTQTDRLDGRWIGAGRFFSLDLAEKLGPLPMELEFKAGELVAGTVGSARVGRAKVSAGRSLVQLSSKLTGRIGGAPELDKEYFILLMTSVSDTSVVAEFHLKSNRAFDPRVREGKVTLARAPR